MAITNARLSFTKKQLLSLSEYVSIRWVGNNAILFELPPGYYPFRFHSTSVIGDSYDGVTIACENCDGGDIYDPDVGYRSCGVCEGDGRVQPKRAASGKHKVDVRVPLGWVYMRAHFTPQRGYDPLTSTWSKGVERVSVDIPWIRMTRRRIGRKTDKFYRIPLPNIYEEDRMCFYHGGYNQPTAIAALNEAVTAIWDSWGNYDSFGTLEENGIWRYLQAEAGAKHPTNVTKIAKHWSTLTVEDFLEIPLEHWYYSAKVKDSIVDGRKKQTLIKAGA